MVSAPQRRAAIELLEHRQDHPGSIVDWRGVAAPVVRQQQFLGLFGTGEETAQRTIDAFIEQPAKAQQHVLWARRPHALLDTPQGLTTQAQRHRLVLFAVGRGP
ncbi:hypothetical protein D3C81_1831030 [compost metagenome]